MKLAQQLRLVYLAGGAVAFTVVAVWIMAPRPRSAPPLSPPPQATVPRAIAGSGLVEARSENLAIANPVPGLITDVAIAPHDQVKKGDLLFSLETRHLEADLTTARRALEVARARAGDAHMKLGLLEGVTDRRAIRKEELESRKFEVAQADAEVARTEAAVDRLAVEIERQHIRAPIDGEILRVEARPGEYAPADRIDPPLVVMGDTSRLHVRVDIAEDLAWRVSPDATATASPRGRGDVRIPVDFVRIEPYVRPKQSLTGNPDERVDTRVVQIIYALPAETPDVYIGQQMDVFVSATAKPTSTSK